MTPDLIEIVAVAMLALKMFAHGASHLGYINGVLGTIIFFFFFKAGCSCSIHFHDRGCDWGFGCGPGGIENLCSRNFSFAFIANNVFCICTIY